MIFPRLAQLTESLDDFLRITDFKLLRTKGGLLQRWFGIRRHAFPALTLPSLLSALLILGSPSPFRVLFASVVGIAVCGAVIWFMSTSDHKGWSIIFDLLFQVLIILSIAALIWIFGTDQYRNVGMYRHALVPITVAVAVALSFGAGASRLIFRRVRGGNYSQYLAVTELFASRGPAPQVTLGTIATAFLTSPFRAPLALLTPTAIVTLLATPVWVKPAAWSTLIVVFVALFVAGLNERFGAMWDLIQGVFFRAGALLVSLVIIILATCRLMQVTYVTTIFDTAAWWSIGFMLLFAFGLSRWYDYWSNRLVCEQILRMLKPTPNHSAQIPYPIDPARCATSVPADHRVLQVHGSSRFIVIRENQPIPYFQARSIDHLIDLLAWTGAPGGKAVPTPVQIKARIYNFHVVAALLFASLVGIRMWKIHEGIQLPEATLKASERGTVVLTTLLQQKAHDPGKPLIVVVASGGGTRAAVYTAAVLEGISKLGSAGDIVLGSGVSGGGAALAYFAGKRPSLITNNRQDWDSYFDTMSKPYIQDVLNRSSEWRIARGGRLGLLLKESFDRNWSIAANRTKLSDIHDIGLIFNTTLAGELVCPASDCGDKLLQNAEPNLRNIEESTLAGGRLLLTNLALPKEMTGLPLEPTTSERLPVVLSSEDLTLQESAALNANFPPVFSNAAIDVNNDKRYWVTDGGAADNRGMEMMLFALRDTLLKDSQSESLPPVYIVVIDASALSDAYVQDRGISSMEGAGSHFASHLDSELVKSIREIYSGHPDRFHFSYLMMPDRIRESGSFGTNWMLQTRITVHEAANGKGASKTITGQEMVAVLRALHTPAFHGLLSPDACSVLEWINNDPGHLQGWTELLTVLGGSTAAPDCRHP